MTTCLDTALEMIEMGLSVIPVRPNDKRPLPGFGWQEFQERIATPEEVEAWFERWPDANLALITGSISGLWAMDADGPRGMDYIAEQCPATSVYQKTPGGGVHALYKLPRGKVVHNGVRVQPELDIRGEGGYIVIAPSVINGRAYELRFIEGLEGWDELAEWVYEPAAGEPRRGNINADLSRFKAPVTPDQPVAQGGRNNELARVAGLYYQKGLDPAEVLDLCLAWNARNCKPPLGQSELKVTVESIGKRHFTNNPPPNPDLQVQVPAPTPPVAEALPADILHPGGILELIMEFIEASSAASVPLFNLAAGVTMLGAVAGQRVMTETGLRTNIYSICLGYSGSGKDAPQSAISALLRESTAAGIHGPTSLTSAPAIMAWMAAKDGSKGSCLLLLDEIGLILGGMKDPRSPAAQVPQLLMELFSATDRPKCKPYTDTRLTFVLDWHHLAMYGSSTPSRFWEAMSSGMTLDGFLARLLIWESRHDAPMPKAQVAHEVPPALVAAINEIFGIEVERTGGNMQMGGIPVPVIVPKSPEAAEAFDPWARRYHDLKNKYKEAEDARSPIYGRAAEHASKLALVHAVSRCGARVVEEQVEVEDVVWAMALVDYLVGHAVQMAMDHIADDMWSAQGKRVMALIKRRATRERPGLTQAEILRSTGLDKAVFDRVLSTLVAAEQVVEVEWQSPKGGPKTKLVGLAVADLLN